jgi:predicted metal-dependent enzyme (double-stranded beta helix superfamily)
LIHHTTTDLNPGQVIVCCTTDQDLHRVSAVGAQPCVGIHVYGGDIGTIRRRSYDVETGDVSWFTSSWGGDVIVRGAV